MVDMPDNILDIVRQETEANPEDIDKAVSKAFSRVKRLNTYKAFTENLVKQALRSMIQDRRHSSNTALRKAAGQYGKPAKVKVGESRSVKGVAQSMYNYYIAGTMLGSLLGKDLQGIANNEAATGQGHLINARLLTSLVKLVPEEKQVRQAVTEKKLHKLYQEAANSA